MRAIDLKENKVHLTPIRIDLKENPISLKKSKGWKIDFGSGFHLQ